MSRSLIFFVCLLPLFGTGQIVIDQSDMPEPGDTLRISSTVNDGSFDFTATGPDHTWEYQDLEPLTQSVNSYVSVTSTPFAYQLFFLFIANLALDQPEFDQFPGFEVTDTYRYFNASGSSFMEVGMAVTLNGLPLPTVYEDPDIIYTFPVQAGQTDSSSSSYSFNIPGLGYYGGWKKRNNTVDGWGSLTTPFGTFDVLRLKAEIEQYDSIYIDSLGMGIPVYQNTTEYKWLGKDEGIPLLKVVDNGLLQTIQYRDSIRDIFTFAVPPESEKGQFRVFPNPVEGDVTIRTGFHKYRPLTIEIFDVTGRQVYAATREVMEIFVLQDDVTAGLHGTFILRLSWEEGSVVKKLVFP